MTEKTNRIDATANHIIFNSDDSDSDSKSDIFFLAVPKQFRPNSTTRKSPVQKELTPGMTFNDNKIFNNGSTSKSLSISNQSARITEKKDTASNSVAKLTIKSEICCSKSGHSVPTLNKTPAKKTNYSIVEDTDEPIRCRNTRKNLSVSEITVKPRMPIENRNQNRQRLLNISEQRPEVEKTTSAEKHVNEIIENNGKDEPIDLSKLNSNIIELDVARLPLIKETKKKSQNKIKFEILTEKEQNHSAIKKDNRINKKYKNTRTNQVSFQSQEFIRWDSDLDLSTLNRNLYSSASQFIEKKCLNAGNDTVEWTVIREEKTFVSAKKIENISKKNCQQIENKRADHNFKRATNFSDNEANVQLPAHGIVRNQQKSVSKTLTSQQAVRNGGKKACDTQTASYKSNLRKEKNVLMFINAGNIGDRKNSESFVNSQSETEYNCCKEHNTRDEYELSKEHCCLCAASKFKNEAKRNKSQVMKKNLFEENLDHYNLFNNKQDSFAEKEKVIGKSCCENEFDCCAQQTFADDKLCKEGFCNKSEPLRVAKNPNFQKLVWNQPRNSNSLQENLRQQNVALDNQNLSCHKGKLNDIKSGINEASNENKNPVLQFGKELSNLVIGCHVSLISFISSYSEWRCLRMELIEQFEKLEKTIRESSNKYERYGDIIKAVNTGATMASVIPHPAVATAAKIITIISSLISKFITTSKSNTGELEEPKITTSFFQDIDLSSELNIYGLQCNQQFEETTKFVEEFLGNSKFSEFYVCDDTAMENFVEGVLEFKPNHRIFYKKLYKCFQELLQNCSSSFSRRFCEPFQLCEPEAVDVIGYLDWRFTQDFNDESVKHELEEIHRLIQNNSTKVKELLIKIGNCVRILKNQLTLVEKCVSQISKINSSLESKNETYKFEFKNFKFNSK